MARMILFDMDGTLLDSIYTIVRTLNDTLAEFNLPPFPDEDLDKLVGMNLEDIVGARTGDLAPVVERYREMHMATFRDDTVPFDGAKELLTHLREDGYGLAVVTLRRSDLASIVLEHFDLLGFFDAVIGWNDVSEAKPSPLHALEACEKLRCAIDDVILVGDSKYDVLCGVGARCTTIGVTWGAARATTSGARARIGWGTILMSYMP